MDHTSGLFDCGPPLDCLATLERIVWSSPAPWPDEYVGPHPLLPIVDLLRHFPSRNTLKSLAVTVRFLDLPMDRAQTLTELRALPDALMDERFRSFEKVQVCAQVETFSGISVEREKMLADLRYVAHELQHIGYHFVLEVKVETREWDQKDYVPDNSDIWAN